MYSDLLEQNDITHGESMTLPITIGVSSCLLGNHVRYDGGHKRDCYISDTLNRHFRLVAVCPEVECGMPAPREPMRLEGDPASPRLMTIETRSDKTGQMLAFCREKVRELDRDGVCGFIFKKNSPSCGLHCVQIYENGIPAGTGTGLFAAAVTGHFRMLPMVEEDSLGNRAAREDFIQRVIAFHERSR